MTSPPLVSDACLHLEVSDEGICPCGTDITSEEFINSLPEVPLFRLGDVIGLVQLARSTVDAYIENLIDTRDPVNPSLPKLMRVGTMLVRLPDMHFWKAMVHTSFLEAKKLGYRRDIKNWESICQDYLTEMTEEDSPVD